MDDKKIGKFIAELREKNGLNQTQFAEKIHFSRTLINKIEHGKVTITSENVKIFSEFFNVSTDEILTGEYERKENKELIENTKLRLVDQNSNLKKKISLSLFTIFAIVFGFLVYFFFTFYNSVTVYTFEVTRDDFLVNNGLVVKTYDKIYLRFEPDISDNNISNINMFYMKNNEKKYIYKFSSEINNVTIDDFYETQEYFDFKQFNKIKDNLYLEVNYKDKRKTDVKLKLEKDYVNKKLILKKNDSKDTEKASSIDNDEVINKFIDKYMDKNAGIEIDNIDYSVVVNEFITIYYNYNNEQFEITYFANSKNLSKSVSNKNIYAYDFNNNKCISGKCDSKDADYDLMIKVLDTISKNSQEI